MRTLRGLASTIGVLAMALSVTSPAYAAGPSPTQTQAQRTPAPLLSVSAHGLGFGQSVSQIAKVQGMNVRLEIIHLTPAQAATLMAQGKVPASADSSMVFQAQVASADPSWTTGVNASDAGWPQLWEMDDQGTFNFTVGGTGYVSDAHMTTV